MLQSVFEVMVLFMLDNYVSVKASSITCCVVKLRICFRYLMLILACVRVGSPRYRYIFFNVFMKFWDGFYFVPWSAFDILP